MPTRMWAFLFVPLGYALSYPSLPQEPAVQLPRAPYVYADAQPTPVSGGFLEYGETLWRELGCLACHEPAGIPGLADRADAKSLAGFLHISPPPFGNARSFPHDFGLNSGEATALAAFLLRSQRVSADQAPPQPGLAWECYEMNINDKGLPRIEGQEPAATGIADSIGPEVRTRDNHFLLRFQAELLIPTEGEWIFHLRSDDSSWLWIDGEKIIANEALAPERTVTQSIALTQGSHLLEVRMTEAAGGEILELEWEGPGFPEPREIPTENFRIQREALIPPPSPFERGFNIPAPKYRGLKTTDDFVGDRMERDGCLSCHTRGNRGGLAESARINFVGDEDLGFEGRLPPSLDKVGHRLREQWILDHLTGERRARPYLHAKCVVLGEADAAKWAEILATTDSIPGDEIEPDFFDSAVEEGRLLAGIQGKNCIECHRVAGHDGPSIQAMDLAIQYDRVKPDWFLEWLQAPVKHRPGTRMPRFWPMANTRSQREQEALRAWSSLGAAMPLPSGLVPKAETYLLEPGDRPLLHGCSLNGLSARCLAVGTPLRTHYAYDLEHLQLRWLWRGAFLNAEGTWRGRNLVELNPVGVDHVVLDAKFPFALLDGITPEPKFLGWRLDPEGWPTFRIQLGNVEIQDAMRPRWVEGGSELVRTLRVLGGPVKVDLPHGDGVELIPDSSFLVRDGESMEVVYRW